MVRFRTAQIDPNLVVVQARPSDIEAMRLLAEIKFAAQDYSGAAYEYRRAIKVGVPSRSLAGLSF